MKLLQNNGRPFPEEDEEIRFPPGAHWVCHCGALSTPAEVDARVRDGKDSPTTCDACRLRIVFQLSYLDPKAPFKPRAGEPLVAAIIDDRLWIGREDDARFYFGRIE